MGRHCRPICYLKVLKMFCKMKLNYKFLKSKTIYVFTEWDDIVVPNCLAGNKITGGKYLFRQIFYKKDFEDQKSNFDKMGRYCRPKLCGTKIFWLTANFCENLWDHRQYGTTYVDPFFLFVPWCLFCCSVWKRRWWRIWIGLSLGETIIGKLERHGKEVICCMVRLGLENRVWSRLWQIIWILIHMICSW